MSEYIDWKTAVVIILLAILMGAALALDYDEGVMPMEPLEEPTTPASVVDESVVNSFFTRNSGQPEFFLTGQGKLGIMGQHICALLRLVLGGTRYG